MHAIVRRATATFCVVLSAGACAAGGARHHIAPTARDEPAPTPITVRFDNQGRARVDVYVVGETRSWRIGRLEPGQARWLPLPSDIPASDLVRLQLAIVPDANVVIDPMRHPRVLATLRQPIGALMAQQWGYAFGQLTSVRGAGARR